MTSPTSSPSRLGGRYTNDKRDATVFRQSYSRRFARSATVVSAVPASCLGAPTSNFEGKRTDTDFTPRASVSFKPNDDHHFYAS